MEITPALSSLVRKKRKEKGLSLKELKTILQDQEVDISISALSAIERGTLSNIKDDSFVKIADLLDINISQSNVVRVGFGTCAWASILINAVCKENPKPEEPL